MIHKAYIAVSDDGRFMWTDRHTRHSVRLVNELSKAQLYSEAELEAMGFFDGRIFEIIELLESDPVYPFEFPSKVRVSVKKNPMRIIELKIEIP